MEKERMHTHGTEVIMHLWHCSTSHCVLVNDDRTIQLHMYMGDQLVVSCPCADLWEAVALARQWRFSQGALPPL